MFQPETGQRRPEANQQRIATYRRGSALAEYALLLAVIGCSALFGARLIMSSGMWQFNKQLSSSWNSITGAEHGKTPPTEIALDNLPTTNAAVAANTSTARQYGSLAALLVVGIAASCGLLKVHRRKAAIAEPELGDAVMVPAGPERFAVKRQEIYRVLCRNLKNLLSSNVKVGHILSNLPVTVLPNKPVAELEALMKDHQIRHLLVCDADGKLLGVVSDRDVSTAQGSTAANIMTPHPCTILASADLRTAITIMLKHRFSSLPVLEDERLVGIITVTDLIIMLQVTLQLLDKFNAELASGRFLDPEGLVESQA